MAHVVFVSFRFSEAEAEANALKTELERRGLKTFVSNELASWLFVMATCHYLGQLPLPREHGIKVRSKREVL